MREHQRSFEAALGRSTGKTEAASPEEAAKNAAEELVTQCFILPLLKQLRATNHSAPPFAPSQAEKQFGALGDAQLAQRITQASHFPLVDRLARDLLKHAGLDASGRSVATEVRSARTAAVPSHVPMPTLDRSSPK